MLSPERVSKSPFPLSKSPKSPRAGITCYFEFVCVIWVTRRATTLTDPSAVHLGSSPVNRGSTPSPRTCPSPTCAPCRTAPARKLRLCLRPFGSCGSESETPTRPIRYGQSAPGLAISRMTSVCVPKKLHTDQQEVLSTFLGVTTTILWSEFKSYPIKGSRT